MTMKEIRKRREKQQLRREIAESLPLIIGGTLFLSFVALAKIAIHYGI